MSLVRVQFGEFGNERRPASKSRRVFSLTGGVVESARLGRRGGRFALSRLRRRIGGSGSDSAGRGSLPWKRSDARIAVNRRA